MEVEFLNFLQQQAFNINDVNSSNLTIDIHCGVPQNFHTKFTEILVNSYNELQRPLIIVEIGSCTGFTTCSIASMTKRYNIPCKMICIDTCSGTSETLNPSIIEINEDGSLNFKKEYSQEYPQLYRTFLNNVIIENNTDIIRPLPVSSNDAFKILKYYNIKADIVYIDGSQDYTSVYNDLSNYYELLHNNGYIFGSNYSDDNEGIKTAVDNFTQAININKTIDDILWIIKKPIN